jgi:phosphoribosylanthranilate isomerase
MNTRTSPLRIKICGVKSASELALLDQYGIDYAGLWWKVPKGVHNLITTELHALSAVELKYTKRMLVTLSAPVDATIDALLQTGIRAIQLHGFELPGGIARLKAAIPDLTIFKTLHVQRGRCIEPKSMISAYRDAGVDVFIADTFLSRDAIGSTGVSIPEAALGSLLLATQGAATMVAGGIDAKKLAMLNETAHLWGVDIDSAARVDGKINTNAVAALARAAFLASEKAIMQSEDALFSVAA